ncbi:MAG TPA: DUF393 domain-containing protein [Acidiferrobacterales bacterium]|jgi:predicted DCC family thiol-disulfide oxidoreductase YuxK
MSNYPLTLYYDGACPLCAEEMQRLKARDRHGLLRFVDASAATFDAAECASTRAELMRVIHARRPDGNLVRGVDALRLAYAAAGHVVIARLLGMTLIYRLACLAYPYLASHRYALSRRLRWRIAGMRRRPACADDRCAGGDGNDAR